MSSVSFGPLFPATAAAAGVNIDMAPLQPSESSDERQARIAQIRARLDDRLRPCTVNITQARWLLGETERLTAELAAVTAERDAATKRVATLEKDLEHALASVGAFRQAIEDVWAKSAGESGSDGFIVSYVISVGVLHRAIGLARGTDAGGALLARLAAVTAERDALREAGDAMSCELALIASDITPKGPRGQIANHPHEVAALKKVKQIAFAREQWRAALAARGGGGLT